VTEIQQWDIVSNVGLTALGVAAARAVETGREGALIRDPFAEPFVRAANPPRPMPTTPRELDTASEHWGWMADFLGVRSRYFDEYFATASGAGIRQVVLLAAGLDARAFRLDWPDGTRLFEVDHPKVLEFKNQVLAERDARPTCERHVVDADLRENWTKALTDAGFTPDTPTAWLVEGLTPYLPAAAEQQLFTEVDRLSAPGSQIGVEWLNDIHAMFGDRMMGESSEEIGVDLRDLWNTEPRTLVDDRLRALGWVLDTETLAQAGARYGRSFETNGGDLIGQHGRLATAQR
jgi:methyltransferase (TIGR00027 family)